MQANSPPIHCGYTEDRKGSLPGVESSIYAGFNYDQHQPRLSTLKISLSVFDNPAMCYTAIDIIKSFRKKVPRQARDDSALDYSKV